MSKPLLATQLIFSLYCGKSILDSNWQQTNKRRITEKIKIEK